jgi:sterol desaturase/sphingolipid hydroxylase (fatty acid hydroxylase superfamily)
MVARRCTHARLGRRAVNKGDADVGKAIAIATPFFFVLIGLEYAWGRVRGRSTYRLNDAVNSLSLGVVSQLANLFTSLLRIGIYTVAFDWLAIVRLPADAWWVWLVGVVFYDLCYYWNHRLGHESAIFWAAHVVHHQSQEFNLSTALRQTATGALLNWIFYLPMTVVGIPPVVFAAVALVDLLYQYWIHTEHIGKLGALDRVFATPSNHRVHHAVNDRYVDRNYGGILIVWDRLFGSFVEESEKCVYGTRAPLDSWDPLWANVEVYAALARKSRHAARWSDKLRVWWKPPGWRPAAAAPADPVWGSEYFDAARLVRYDPPTTRAVRTFATVQLVAAIVATLPLLWFSDTLDRWITIAAATAITGMLWVTGAVLQGRIAIAGGVAIEAAALAIAAWVVRAL